MTKFNIIIPTYNRANLLPRAIESILKQNYQNRHIYIIDDGSTDNTKQVVQKYIEQYPDKITYKYKPNWWVGSARNLWIELALQNNKNPQNAWIIFLDSDDEIIPYWLNDLSKVINRNTNYLHFIWWTKNEKNKITGKVKNIWELDYKKYISWKYTKWEPFWLFNLKIFTDKNLRFNEKVNWGETILIWDIYKKYPAYTLNKIYRIYHQDNPSLIRVNHLKLSKKQIKNHIKITEINIDKYKNDLIEVWNKKLVWIWYMVLWRMHTLLWEYKKWFKYFINGLKYNPFDIKRIGTYIISLFSKKQK